MEKQIIYNSNLHFEHEIWRRELFFWKDELIIFNNRLSEMVTRWTKKEVLKQLEHFQNEFILHGGVIEDLLEEIEIHEASMAGQDMIVHDAMDTVMVKKHMEFRKKMETQEGIYADLKKDFFRFLTKYL
jgi:Flp pilus assembly CpaF family ATPase